MLEWGIREENGERSLEGVVKRHVMIMERGYLSSVLQIG